MPTDADVRADRLLRSVLSSEMARELDAQGWFTVVGSAGGEYRLRLGRFGNVRQEDPEKVTRYCIHPVDDVPDADTVLSQVLLLWTDEPAFLATANSSTWTRIRALVPADLPTNGDPLLPCPTHPQAMARVRLIKTCLETEAGTEALAQTIVARIRHGGVAPEAVAVEVTQFARLVDARSTSPEPGEGVRAVREWLRTGFVPEE
jgi:hypothetical protein